MTYNTLGIILRINNYSEYSRVFTIYSPLLGKKRVVARSSKKAASKLSRQLQYFSLLDFYLARGRSMDIVAGVTCPKNYRQIKKNLFAISLASYCLEVLDVYVKDGEPDLKIYELLLDYFTQTEEHLIQAPGQGYQKMIFQTYMFCIKLMDILGYMPHLDTCVFCKEELLGNTGFFSYDEGGVTCDICREKAKHTDILSTETSQVIKKIVGESFFDTSCFSTEVFKELSRIVPLFIKYHQDKDLKTEEFLKVFI